MDQSSLDLEIELIESSLLASEKLSLQSEDSRIVDITSAASKLALHLTIGSSYPDASSLQIEVKGPDIGREEAEGWSKWVKERMRDWRAEDDYPLFQLMTTHFLPLLAPQSPVARSRSSSPAADQQTKRSTVPHHALLTSHHLLSNTKRKDLISLSSSLSLVGFSKTGHPGIMYAIGSQEDLGEWIREVKSWNWLALRVRMTAEPICGAEELEAGRGSESGARGGKGRGEWTELEKISEALDWLRARGRQALLLDIGMGGGNANDKA